MAGEADKLAALRALVEAHAVPHPGTDERVPIYFFRGPGPSQLQHHGLSDPTPSVDDALISEMQVDGMIDIEYHEHSWDLVPTSLGRRLIEGEDRLQRDAAADVTPLVSSVAAQADSSNKLGWPLVRPVLAALRAYWEEAGFSHHGVPLPPLVKALPDEQQALFAATIRALVAEEYLVSTSGLRTVVEPNQVGAIELPAEVELTGRAHTVLDGWPGAGPEQLVENLLAVLAKEAAEEPDPVKKKRLVSLIGTVKEIGVATAGEVLSRVLTGGL